MASPESLPGHYRPLVNLGNTVTGRALLEGNQVTMLLDGEQTYSAMLEAIREARQRVYLCSYIFESGGVGRDFIDALCDAHQRGVEVRVLLDGVGQLYSLPGSARLLRRQGVPVALYLPPRLFPPNLSVNLRNHRKILVVDGHTAFTGGANIRPGYMDRGRKGAAVSDLHFRLQGPVVLQLADVFVQDWHFCQPEHDLTTEHLPPPERCGEALCRVIEDGPNEDLDKLPRLLVAALAAARHHIRIMTPYFLPPRELILALQNAAMRGVAVDIIMPENNNLPYVKWAAIHMYMPLLRTGVRLHYRQGVFVHSKLCLVDNGYALLGSANLDPRSLRLNFELMVEVYDAGLAGTLEQYFSRELARSREITVREVLERPHWQRVRDALCWLASPYL